MKRMVRKTSGYGGLGSDCKRGSRLDSLSAAHYISRRDSDTGAPPLVPRVHSPLRNRIGEIRGCHGAPKKSAAAPLHLKAHS